MTDLFIIQLLLFLLRGVSNDNIDHNHNCDKVTNNFEMSHSFDSQRLDKCI